LTRRDLLAAGAAAGAAVAWIPAFRIPIASAADGCAPPPGFPGDIELYRQAFENWSKAIVIDDLWTCAPRTPQDVVRLANWAHRHGWRIRPRGAMHNWSPICVTAETTCESKVVLVDTMRYLKRVEMLDRPGKPAIRAEAGATILELTVEAEGHGYGFATLPATGDPTIGGGLAIGIHGAGVPAVGERRMAGQTYGSLSNLVVSLTAVVWSRRRNRYVLRTFHRSDPGVKALLVNLGRTFVTSVTLRVAENQNLRCETILDIPAAELFAAPGSHGRTFASFIDDAGRAEAIWFQFTENPWLKVWSVSPQKPASSREVSAPYNYPFSDNVPEPVTDLVSEILTGNGSAAEPLGQAEYAVVMAGTTAFDTDDLWGKSKNVLFYIRQTTLRVDELGLALLTSRRHIQRIVHEFTTHYGRRLDELSGQDRYPINGPIEIRACGLDRPGDVEIPGAESPALSATVPRRDRPGWDTVLWLNPLTTASTPGQYEFYREIERWTHRHFAGIASLRPEWSKGWAGSREALWADEHALRRTIPRTMSAGRRETEDFDWARRRLNRFDPHRVFSNGFLDRLLPG
jgi:FAD/FMN-containing dehydrogenase